MSVLRTVSLTGLHSLPHMEPTLRTLLSIGGLKYGAVASIVRCRAALVVAPDGGVTPIALGG